MKKILCAILTLAMLAAIVPIVAMATSKTQDEAVAWINGRINQKAYNTDAMYGAQCVDFIQEYYRFLGVNGGGGNAIDYASNSLPVGFERIQDYIGFIPSPGDIGIWHGIGSNPYGHVGIVVSADGYNVTVADVWGSEANLNHNVVGYDNNIVHRITRPYSASAAYGQGAFWGVIRPNFGSAPTPTLNSVTIETNAAHTVTETSAAMVGTFKPNGCRITKRGFVVGTDPNNLNREIIFDCDITWDDGLTHNQPGLTPGTTYYYKFVVGDGTNYKYGDVMSFTTSGAPKPTEAAIITVANVIGRAGEEVEVPISIAENPGIAMFNLRLSFDKTRLTPVLIARGGALSAGTLTSDIQQGEDLSALEFVTAHFTNSSNISANGTLFTVKFRLKESAAGNIPLALTYIEGDICDQGHNDIAVNIINGEINVESAPLPYTINSFKITNAAGSEIAIPASGSFYARVSVTKNIARDAEDCIIAAMYDENGILLDLTYMSGKFEANQTASFGGLLKVPEGRCVKYVKAFVWESLSSQTPLSEATTIE